MEDLEEVAREVAGAGDVVQQEIDRAQENQTILTAVLVGLGVALALVLVAMLLARARPWRRTKTLLISDNRGRRGEASHVYLDDENAGVLNMSFTAYPEVDVNGAEVRNGRSEGVPLSTLTNSQA
nr:uncharacterized protein LOC113803637 [Penaeus vannamei]